MVIFHTNVDFQPLNPFNLTSWERKQICLEIKSLRHFPSSAVYIVPQNRLDSFAFSADKRCFDIVIGLTDKITETV